MLKIKNLSLRYKDNMVFEQVNLEVDQGEIVVITGKSGCGKSSLLKAVNGIIEESEQAYLGGDIEVDGQSIIEDGISKRSQSISTVFQNPKTQFYCINSTDEMAFALENRNICRTEIENTIQQYTQLLETTSLLDKNIFTLSGGEKQMVAITAVTCMNNLIYLFDEPSASLDHEAIERFRKILIMLKHMGKIVVVAEHRLYYLKEIADQLVILDDHKMQVLKLKTDKDNQLKKAIVTYGLRTLKDIRKADLRNQNYHKICLTDGIQGPEYEELLCENFKTRYQKEQILDVSLSFSKGIHFIIGANGVGKSSFIKKLAGLAKGPGKSYFGGQRIKKSHQIISMVMQDVNYQLFTESVWQELSIVCVDDERKKRVLEDLDLYDKKDFHPQILSGGEKQRLQIGMAKISDKSVIILDEPTSGLCKGKMSKMIEYLHEMASLGKVVIVITHDYELITQCGGSIYEFTR